MQPWLFNILPATSVWGSIIPYSLPTPPHPSSSSFFSLLGPLVSNWRVKDIDTVEVLVGFLGEKRRELMCLTTRSPWTVNDVSWFLLKRKKRRERKCGVDGELFISARVWLLWVAVTLHLSIASLPPPSLLFFLYGFMAANRCRRLFNCARKQIQFLTECRFSEIRFRFREFPKTHYFEATRIGKLSGKVQSDELLAPIFPGLKKNETIGLNVNVMNWRWSEGSNENVRRAATRQLCYFSPTLQLYFSLSSLSFSTAVSFIIQRGSSPVTWRSFARRHRRRRHPNVDN